MIQTKFNPQWILGFVDGEGFHIGITANKTFKIGYQVFPEFSIVQHEKDYALLMEIKEFFNCGLVQLNRGKSDLKHAPRWCFRVRNRDDLNKKIIPFFEKNSLLTMKSLDFNAFKTVVNMMNQGLHLTDSGLTEIRNIKSQMNRNRSIY